MIQVASCNLYIHCITVYVYRISIRSLTFSYLKSLLLFKFICERIRAVYSPIIISTFPIEYVQRLSTHIYTKYKSSAKYWLIYVAGFLYIFNDIVVLNTVAVITLPFRHRLFVLRYGEWNNWAFNVVWWNCLLSRCTLSDTDIEFKSKTLYAQTIHTIQWRWRGVSGMVMNRNIVVAYQSHRMKHY